jgi:hypothetical protein
MSEIVAVLVPETVSEPQAETQEQTSAEPSPIVIPKPVNPKARSHSFGKKHQRSSNNGLTLALPIAWVLSTILVIILTIVSTNPSGAIDTICQNSQGSKDYCRLLVQLVGPVTLQEQFKNTALINDENQEKSLEFCEYRANIEAKKIDREKPYRKTPRFSSDGVLIFLMS